MSKIKVITDSTSYITKEYAIKENLTVVPMLEDKFPNALITIDELGPVIGAHLGPKTLGFCFF